MDDILLSDLKILSPLCIKADDSYLYVAVEDFNTEVEGFLTVKKGQLVEVLDQGANNWLVVTLASAPGELEDEGFLPARCLQPASKSQLYIQLHCTCQ